MKRRIALLTALAALTASPYSFGETVFPQKSVTFIVPLAAGGGTDILARKLALNLASLWGQPVVVENASGASSIIGTQRVARAASDGYTLLVTTNGAIVSNRYLFKSLPYDPDKDFIPVAQLADIDMVLLAHQSLGANNLKELVALSKTTDLNFAVTASGSAPHLAGVAVERATGAKWVYVPYKGGVQAIQDTVGGQTQVLMNGMLATLPHVQSGKLKLLGVSKGTRMPLIGDTPTIAEQGVPGFESGTWQGVRVARGTPDAVVQRLNKELIAVIRSADIRSRLAGQGAEVVTMTPAEEEQFFAKERARWAQVVNAANIKLD